MLTATKHDPRALPMQPGEAVRYLRSEVGLTESELAIATGASTRTVRRWFAERTEPQARYADRIDDLRAIITVLEDYLTPKAIRQWLHQRNRNLRGSDPDTFVRPIDLIGEGEFDQVQRAAHAIVKAYYI